MREGVAGPEEGAADQDKQAEAERVREAGELLMEKDEEADGENTDADPLPGSEVFAEPADGAEDDEQRGELDDNLGGGGVVRRRPQRKPKLLAAKPIKAIRRKSQRPSAKFCRVGRWPW